jgi:hypothetical protein
MQVAVSALADTAATAYRSLAIYPQDTRIPVDSVARYWAHLWGHSPEQTRRQLEAFADRELLTLEGEMISFHDLQRTFLLLQAEDLSVLHTDLLDAYRMLLPSPTSVWSELPQDEPYIWEQLVYHLTGAGDGTAVLALVTDLAYLARRCFRAGPYAVESDLRQAAALYPNDKAIRWLLRLFTQWGRLLTAQPTVDDLAVTLASRTSRTNDAPTPINADPLAGLLPACFLAPQWGLPSAPAALTRVLKGHTGPVNGVAFSPDGSRLATTSEDGTVRVWDPATGHPTITLEGHTGGVWGVAFSPDGRQLATASEDGTVRLWDPATGHPTTTLKGHTGGVWGVAFSPDGRQLASASYDGTVRLWDPATGHPTTALEGHAGWVRAVAFSPDGCQLASADSDGTVRLWDPATGHPTITLEGHTGGVWGWRSRPTGGSSRAPAATGRCGCVIPQTGGASARSRATPTGCEGWRSHPTAGCSPAPATTARCGCGTPPPASPPPPWKATPTGCERWRSHPTAIGSLAPATT